jgi:hypothetical protein
MKMSLLHEEAEEMENIKKKTKRINFLFMKKDGYGNFVQYF